MGILDSIVGAVSSVATKLVAATDNALEGKFRLAVESTGEGATIKLGDKTASGQQLPWVYVTTEGAFMEFDLEAGTVTVLSGSTTENMQAVTYDLDSVDMHGRPVTVGDSITVTFSYDGQAYVNQTPRVIKWTGTTDAQYGEDLAERLGETTNEVVDFRNKLLTAQARGRYGRATRAPRGAEPVIDIRATEDSLDLTVELDHLEPTPIQIPHDSTGKTFVGRVWDKDGQHTTMNELVDAGYRMGVVEFDNGDIAVLLPNFRGDNLGIKIASRKHGPVERLVEGVMDQKLAKGTTLQGHSIADLSGDTSKAGQFATPRISKVIGIGPEVEKDATVDYPVDDSLVRFEMMLKDAVERTRSHAQQSRALTMDKGQPQQQRRRGTLLDD